MGLRGSLGKKNHSSEKSQLWWQGVADKEATLSNGRRSPFWTAPGPPGIWRKTQLAHIYSAAGWTPRWTARWQEPWGEWRWQAGSQKNGKQIYGLKADPTPQWRARDYHLQRAEDCGLCRLGNRAVPSLCVACIRHDTIVIPLAAWKRLVVIDLHFNPLPLKLALSGDSSM